MYETLTFPVADCPICKRRVLIAQGLDACGELVDVCTRCDAPLPVDNARKSYGGYALKFIGYDVEGEGQEQRGCGSGGGCGTGGGCSTGSCGVG